MESPYLVSPRLMKVAVAMVVMIFHVLGDGDLKTGFYSSSCPKAESIVRSTVENYFNKDPTLAAALLRLHFHDCFVQVVLYTIFNKICFTFAC